MTATPPTAAEPTQRRYNRYIVWLGIGIVVACVAYTAGWFYLADRLETRTEAGLASLQGGGTTAECANRSARGFPFRLGLYCDSVAFSRAADGLSLKAGAFRSTGQIYDPARLVAELDGPATLTAPGIGDLSLDWTTLRASVRIARPVPERVSVEGGTLSVKTAAGTPLAAAQSFEGHLRPNAADLDLAASVAALAIDPALVRGRVLPAISGEADIGVTAGVALLADPARDLKGKSGTIRKLSLSLGPTGGIELTGPFAIDAAGLLDADFMVSVRDPQALSAALATAFPEAAKQIGQGFMGLSLLGDTPTLPLKVSKGSAVLGFIPLGKIPPLE